MPHRKRAKKRTSLSDMNDVARAITLREGLKRPLTIADVKEVLRVQRELVLEEHHVDIYAIQTGKFVLIPFSAAVLGRSAAE